MDERREVFYHRLRHMLAEIDQFFTDVACYNAAHPDEPPIEADPDRELGHLRVRMIVTLELGTGQDYFASFEDRRTP